MYVEQGLHVCKSDTALHTDVVNNDIRTRNDMGFPTIPDDDASLSLSGETSGRTDNVKGQPLTS